MRPILKFVRALSLAAVVLATAGPVAGQTPPDKPTFSAKTRTKTALDGAATEASILANIENQKMILDLEDPSRADYPRMIVALADFYWDLSEIYFRRSQGDGLEQAIFDAEEANDPAGVARLKAQQQSLRDQQRAYQDETIAAYRRVIREFPKAKELDEFRYYLGYNLTAMGSSTRGSRRSRS